MAVASSGTPRDLLDCLLIEAPTEIEVVVNLEPIKALDIDVPLQLQRRPGEFIE